MAVQEKSGDTVTNPGIVPNNKGRLDPGKANSKGVEIQLKGLHPTGEERVPKARKPYTITKHRERWTEEEHKKFLEALKLYGRAWRRIEEHVGSKTAVQIRSHAQKFFSKVVRESGGSNADSVKAIEIPPPRPKRKPMHPYPRKLIHITDAQGTSISERVERSFSPILCEPENGSPSAVGSDTMCSTVTNSPNGCSSPVSSVAGSNRSGLCLAEQENGQPSLVVLGSRQMNKLQVKADMDRGDQVVAKEGSSTEAPKTYLKLFGKTLLVTESHKPSSVTGCRPQSPKSLHLLDNENRNHIFTDEEKAVQTTAESPWQKNVSATPGKSARSPLSYGVQPLFYCMQLPRDDSSSFEAASSLPWWSWYGGLQFPHAPPSQNAHARQLPDEASDEKEMTKDGPSTSSSMTSACEMGKLEKNNDVACSGFGELVDKEKEPLTFLPLMASENSAFSKPSVGNGKRAFVPYKRCLAARDGEQSECSSEEEKGQKIRLCL